MEFLRSRTPRHTGNGVGEILFLFHCYLLIRYESDLVIIYAYHFVAKISNGRIILSATLDGKGDLISPVTCTENIPAPDQDVIYDPVTIKCSPGVTGRYLRITRDLSDELQFCEAEIYGKIDNTAKPV